MRGDKQAHHTVCCMCRKCVMWLVHAYQASLEARRVSDCWLLSATGQYERTKLKTGLRRERMQRESHNTTAQVV